MPNRLAHSTSPYLQQHADNPVDWHEWGPDALAAARESGKPILLSIGYSACHWCHVMAHESFEDETIAALMNDLFINIKVDREERPDIDQIYQSAHALLAQRSGGWPLTMFLMPDTTPFFGGTYFPQTPRHGLPGFRDLLRHVEQLYRERQPEIREQNASLLAALRQSGAPPRSDAQSLPTAAAIDAARANIVASFDAEDGGFGHAPKFPHPEMLEFCLRRHAATGDAQMRHIACFTLERMCRGGIFDQLGGGFARYSTDGEWTIPHFEKMLYDNGPLLRLLADAWLVAESPAQKALFADCAAQTAGWVMREMQSLEGGYFSSLDADSEGHEGKFYVWTRDEVRGLLNPDQWRVAEHAWGLDQPPNFEGAHWNLTNRRAMGALSAREAQPESVCSERLAIARAKLFAARATRIHPGRDDKVLTSWNALMIEGMAHAARVFGRDDWHASARRALDFVRHTMWDPATRRLRATHKDGQTHLNAYLDDYAYLLKAIVEVAQAGFSGADLSFGREIADVMLEQFEDAAQGGFHFTSHDHESLIVRPKPGFDNATPSGNGVAAFALQRLSHLTNDLRYAAAAERTLACFGGSIARQPAGHCSLLMALEEWLEPTRVLILAGPGDALGEWQRRLAALYLPSTVVLALANGSREVPEALRRPSAAEVAAYLCRGVSCLPAISDLDSLEAALRER